MQRTGLINMQTGYIFARSSTLIGFCFKYWKLNVSCLDGRLDCAWRAKTSNPLPFRSHSFIFIVTGPAQHCATHRDTLLITLKWIVVIVVVWVVDGSGMIWPSLISVMFRRCIHVLFVNPPRHCVHITQTLIVPLMSSHLNCSQCWFLQRGRVPVRAWNDD